MRLLLLVALLVCASHQFGMKPVGRHSGVRQTAPSPTRERRGNGYNTGMGPYDIELERVHECEDPGSDLLKFNIEAYNTKTEGGSKIVYRGNFTMPFTADQLLALGVKIRVYRMKDHKHFQMLKYDENLCETIQGAGKDIYIETRSKVGLEGNECTFPEGFYSFDDWDIKVNLPPPVLEYGNYKATTELNYENQTIFCVEAHGKVKQKS